ncbi:MAG: esterase [Candidatus Hydrogenedentes bacterium]|nr:esterase [Candidatus Hydrogenedentota bacterium]
MKRWIALAISLAICTGCAMAFAQRKPGPNTEPKTVQVGNLTRTYLLHVSPSLPPDKPCPLVFVFHGGGGNGQVTERLTQFSPVADREGFIAVYPDGIGKNWNDGREPYVSPSHRDNVDDVGFVSAMIDAVSQTHAIDPKRIFATGISNGAIFSHYVGAKLSTRFAAIAPVVGGIAEPFAPQFKPDEPVSVFILQGTDDPLDPYHGGGVAGGRRGHIIDTDKTVELWTRQDGCATTPQTGELPDSDPSDACRVKWSTWSKGRNGTEVTLYTIEGGGHTWPGGSQFLPKFIVGRVCHDFDATQAIWEFFTKHPKP